MTIDDAINTLLNLREGDSMYRVSIAQGQSITAVIDEIRQLRSKLVGMTGERDDERFISREWENKCDDLEAKLAAMTAARDAACDLAASLAEDAAEYGSPPRERIAELRAVGKEQS